VIIGLALLGAVTVSVMYVMISRFQYSVRGSTSIIKRVVITAANVIVALVGVWGAVKIAHTYRGGNGFMWAFLVVGVLCPFVDRHKGKLRSIINRKVHTRP
jgi:hypothetical protein